jgi:phenylalanyl-tRNA synthetase beta chain
MKISYNWLKQYTDIDIEPVKLSEVLTNCGLEVENLEEFNSIKGGLKGCVIGEVKNKIKHPCADKLTITTVDIGKEELLNIICGAPNVEVGQKVVVATIGTTLNTAKGELEIKKSKIRGELSEGMICAEDELGLGISHEGIMVLNPSAIIGTLASEYFKIEQDWIFELGLTPNRADAMSHIGVARDIAAALTSLTNKGYHLNKPSVVQFRADNTDLKIDVVIEDIKACPRYTGITLKNVHVSESPVWLQNRLKSIGLRTINNIVDIANYVLFETGQPLHAFDADKISGNKILVKKLSHATKFVTLDEIERLLTSDDLMICNESEGICIAGVFGGIKSGVTESTKNIFIESAYFDPVHIRKTSKYHGLKTDASFRFERGVDPDMVVFALKRAALLIKEIAGGIISSDIVDIYPSPILNFKVNVDYSNVDKLIGKAIDRGVIKNILISLGIKIISENQTGLELSIPPFKVDVQREVDVIEEILRIYGYNNIEEPQQFRISPSNSPIPDKEKIQNVIADYLSSNGFSEIMNNSLTKSSYPEGLNSFDHENDVKILNPLSNELSVMRRTMLFGGLESILYNHNRKNFNLKFYEFGKVYKYIKKAVSIGMLENFEEKEQLALFISGAISSESWHTGKESPANFYFLKSYINNIFKRAGIDIKLFSLKEINNDIFSEGLSCNLNGFSIATLGKLTKSILKKIDIKQDIFYAEIEWENVITLTTEYSVLFKDIPKFPEVRRDLALLIDKKIRFSEIEELAYITEPKLLKQVNLFDVYSGEKISENKKSYAVSFKLQDDEKTLTDTEIEHIMNKLINAYTKKLEAVIR